MYVGPRQETDVYQVTPSGSVLSVTHRIYLVSTVRCKILTVENIDKFDEFPVIRQYFPYQNFPFSYFNTVGDPAPSEIKLYQ